MKIGRVVAAVIPDGDNLFATARGYGEFKGHLERKAHWLTKENLGTVQWLPADVAIIKKIKERI